MANVQVTSAGVIDSGNRLVVRSSGGTVYVFVNNGGNIQAFKGNAQPPTSFTEQDAANAPDNAEYDGVAAWIDSADLVHVVYQFRDTAAMTPTPEIRYATFRTIDHATSQDVWVITDEKVATLDNGGGFSAFNKVAIALDANNDPHVSWTEQATVMGADLETVSYANKIGGSWNAKVVVAQKSAASGIMGMLDMIVADPASSVNADRPIIICEAEGNETDLDAYHGTALNATAFTQASDVTGASGIIGEPTIAIDSAEKIVIAFIEQGTADLMIVEHLNSSAWGTWQTPADVDTAQNYTQPSIVINGTNMYIFTISTADFDLRLWKNLGAGWSEETADTHLPQVGTFGDPHGKWQNRNNFEGGVQLDYVFADGGGAVRWQEFSLVTTNTKTFSIDARLVNRRTKTFLADAILLAVKTKTFLIDSVLKAVQTKTFSIDAALKDTFTKTFTIDARVAVFVKTFTLDAILKKFKTQKTFRIDAALQDTFTKTFTIDARVGVFAKTFTIDARLKGTLAKTFLIDAALKAVQTKTFLIDAALLTGSLTKTFLIDSHLKAVPMKTFLLDGVLIDTFTKTFSLDAIIELVQTKIFALDAILKNTFNKTFSIDGALSNTFNKTFSADAILSQQTIKSFLLDALLLGKPQKTFTIDAILEPNPNVLPEITDINLISVATRSTPLVPRDTTNINLISQKTSQLTVEDGS